MLALHLDPRQFFFFPLHLHQFVIFGRQYSFQVFSISFAGTISYNGIHGCQKCQVVGKYSGISDTVVFTKINQEPRTDAEFRAKQYPDHQKSDTALTQLPIDLIKDIIVADELHLLELGVVKGLIKGWRTGKLGFATKWSANVMEQVSERLIKIEMPMEVNRDVRSLKLFACWKGQEFRHFLLYYGFVVLKDFLPEQYYLHFLQLFTASTICSAKPYLIHLNCAQILFDLFINDYKRLYGSQFLTSNVHNLTHVVADVARFGELSTISAYPFENYLGIIKRIIKGGNNPLVQIAKRLTERLFIDDYNYKPDDKPVSVEIVNRDRGITLKLPNFSLKSNNFPDQWFSTEQNKVMCMKRAFKKNNKCFVIAYTVKNITNFFTEPFDSNVLNIYQAKVSDLQANELLTLPVSQIKFKYVAIMQNDYCVFTPLLHTVPE